MEIMIKKPNPQSGSAIFLVLIGIALFAALSFVVAQSLRVSGDSSSNMDQEKMALQMTEMTQFLESVKVKVNTMVEVDRVYDLTLSFKNDAYKDGLDTVLCQNNNPVCSDPSCMVFSPENPNGILPVKFTQAASSAPVSSPGEPVNGSVTVGQLAIEGVGSPAQDLVLIVHGVSAPFCNFYNEKLGINVATPYTDATTLNDIGEPAGSSTGTNWGGCGSDAAFDGSDTFGEDNKNFAGKKTFCSPRRPSGITPTLGVVHVLRPY